MLATVCVIACARLRVNLGNAREKEERMAEVDVGARGRRDEGEIGLKMRASEISIEDSSLSMNLFVKRAVGIQKGVKGLFASIISLTMTDLPDVTGFCHHFGFSRSIDCKFDF